MHVLFNTAVPAPQWYVLLQVKPHATVIPVLTYVGGTDSTSTLFGVFGCVIQYGAGTVHRKHYVTRKLITVIIGYC